MGKPVIIIKRICLLILLILVGGTYSITSWAFCGFGNYRTELRRSNNELVPITVYFRVFDERVIQEIVIVFKNYSPPCPKEPPINGPFSGGVGRMTVCSNGNCGFHIEAKGPRFVFSMDACYSAGEYFGTWTMNIGSFCSDGGSSHSTGTGGNSTGGSDNSGGDDDDDDDDAGTFSDGGQRVKTGAFSPEAKLIGLDFQISPNILRLPQVDNGSTPPAMATVRLLFSNGRLQAVNHLDIDKLKISSNSNFTFGNWKDPKNEDDRKYLLDRNLDPNTTTIVELTKIPSVPQGNYRVYLEYDEDPAYTFQKAATVQVIRASADAAQAAVVPPPPRKLFHRGVK